MSMTQMFRSVIAVVLWATSAGAQAPTVPQVPAPPTTPTTAAPADGEVRFQKTAPTPEAAATPPVAPGAAVVGPGNPEPDGKVPKAATVRETVPAGAPAAAPPDSKPVLSAPVPPAEVLPIKPKVRYFLMIFGAESVPKRGRWTHTWMTIVRATPKSGVVDPYDPAADQKKYYDLLAHTISWMPQSLRIRVLKLRAEPGVNLDLHRSLRFTLGNCERVALWGPYEVNPLVAEELYAKTLKQIAKLNSGCVLYKSLDFEGSAAAWCKNCIHAVSDLDGIQRRLSYNEVRHNGWEGSRVIVRYMAAANRIDTDAVHEWVAQALDVDKYRLSRQSVRICEPQSATPAVAARR